MSQKPAIFFSHSSKDKDNILTLKSALDRITGGTLDVFLSSDGQSIRFGTNWVHSIEEGLSHAEIMFVFVTPNSLKSDWIYFESGYAYCKGIDVIPVGIGVDVGLLNPPLNLLQGFNLRGVDSLNNIISIINKKFNFTFSTVFTDENYSEICNTITNSGNLWPDTIKSITTKIGGAPLGKGDVKKFEIVGGLKPITKYLDQCRIPFSLSVDKKELLVLGICVTYSEYEESQLDNSLRFIISPYNLQESFHLLIELLTVISASSNLRLLDRWHIDLVLNSQFYPITESEKIASIILNSPDLFSLMPTSTKFFTYKDLHFRTEDNCNMRRVYVDFPLSADSFLNINNLLSDLVKLAIIKK